MKRIFIGDGPTDVPKYEWNLLSFGETRNMKFNRCFFKSFHWVMLAFWQIYMCKDWKKSAQCSTKCVWFSKSLSQIYPCCNKYQVNLFLFQRFDIMLSYPVHQRQVSAPKGVIFISHHSWDFLQFCESLTNTATRL